MVMYIDFKQDKIPDVVPVKYDPSRKRILVQSSGKEFFDHPTLAYTAWSSNIELFPILKKCFVRCTVRQCRQIVVSVL